uniref:Uncharacterized protein n=1 Tax=Avena sativa TaxID=4498 RepID=A0ACD5YK31_AVESA
MQGGWFYGAHIWAARGVTLAEGLNRYFQSTNHQIRSIQVFGVDGRDLTVPPLLLLLCPEIDRGGGGSESERASSVRIRSGEMLGKRQRSMLMRRTTSVASLPSVAKQVRQASGGDRARAVPSSSASAGAVGTGGAISLRRDASDLAGMMTAAFLTACGFCGKGLGPGKDTYIYRGEVAFCSHECRELQIEQDELMEQNCSLTSIREAAPSAAGGSDQSGSGAGDAVAAA